jgi:hypothetical protein
LEVRLDHATAIRARMLSDIGLVTEPHKMRAKMAHECKMARDTEGLHAWGKVAKVSETRRTVYPLALISESE